jgi:hypothetical protein
MPVLLDPCTSANIMTDLPIRNHVSSIFNPILGQIRGLIGKQVQEIKRKEGKPPKVIALLFTTPACAKDVPVHHARGRIRKVFILVSGCQKGVRESRD